MPEKLMDNINVLLVNADRRINNLIESAVLDVCYNRGLAHFTRTTELAEFVRLAPSEGFSLMVLVVEHTFLVQKAPQKLAGIEEVVDAIASVHRRFAPLMVVSTSDENKKRLLEAGADCMMKFPFNRESLKLEFRRILKLPEVKEEPANEAWSQTGLWLRLLNRLRSA
jgi:hypothetical protein